MRTAILIISSFMSCLDSGIAQFDLFHFKQKITSQDSMTMFLAQFERSDQKYRGVEANGAHDITRLESLCFYFNHHPFPNASEESKVFGSVWIHSPFLELKRISFPMIYELFKAKHITESQLRSYYLRGFYNELHFPSVEEYLMNTKLKVLIDEFQLPKTDTIDITKLKEEINRIKELRKNKKQIIQTWKGKDRIKEYDYNGETIMITYGGHRHEVYKRGAKYFYNIIHPDGDPTNEGEEIIQLRDGKFKLIKKKANVILEIDKNGDLIKSVNGNPILSLNIHG